MEPERPPDSSPDLESVVPVPDVITPIGFGTPYVESLTGFFQRLANAYVLAPQFLFEKILVPAMREQGLWKGSRADLFRRNSRAIDGGGAVAHLALDTLSDHTRRSDLAPCTMLSLFDAGRIQDDALLVRHKRWCPECWHADLPHHPPYERKLWVLSVVDSCPVHSTVLMDRCFFCGRQQPPIAADVRPGTCALCGESLTAAPVRLPADTVRADASRRLWYAGQAVALVHGADVAALHRLSTSDLDCARESGLRALRAKVKHDGSVPVLIRSIDAWMKPHAKFRIEELFSVLWRARFPVSVFFPAEIREVLDAHPHVRGS